MSKVDEKVITAFVHPLDESLKPLIAEKAYLRAERRGFEPGHEIEDWLEAEAEIRAVYFDLDS